MKALSQKFLRMLVFVKKGTVCPLARYQISSTFIRNLCVIIGIQPIMTLSDIGLANKQLENLQTNCNNFSSFKDQNDDKIISLMDVVSPQIPSFLMYYLLFSNCCYADDIFKSLWVSWQ